MWSHFAEQAKWKRMILEKAVSLYLVVDSSKLSEGRYAGQLLMGDEQDKPKWDELWKKWEKQTDFHVVVGHDREAKLPQSCKAAAKWLKGKLGDRFITEPDYSDWP
jgi:hypothetical protein